MFLFSWVVEVKIKALDKELIGYKEQLKKAKGPTAEHIKKRAMDTLKRKKMYEAQRDQMAGQAFNVEQTAFAIESIKDTQTTVSAMKAASKTLKAEQKKINLSEIEDMQDDLAGMSKAFIPFPSPASFLFLYPPLSVCA